MFLMVQPYAIALAISIFILALLAIVVLKQWPTMGTHSFVAIMAGVSLWACAALVSALSIDPQIKIISFKIQFLFIVSVPLSWFTFSFYYANQMQVLRPSRLAVLALPQVITVLMVATNDMHHLMFTSFEMVTVANHYVSHPHFGPWFWIHTGYSYLLLLAGYVLLAKHLMDSPAHYRRPVISLMIGGFAPTISNIFYAFQIGPLTYFDLTPIAFSVTGVAFMWGILRYRLLHIIPIARDVLIQNLSDGVVVVDTHEHILDINPAAARFIGLESQRMIGAKAPHRIPWWPTLQTTEKSDTEIVLPLIELQINHELCLLQPMQLPLFAKEKPVGFLITLRDVTDTIIAQRALRHSEERFKSFSENAPVIIFALDGKGIISYINRAWRRILGYPASDAVDRALADYVATEDRAATTDILDQMIDGRRDSAELNVHMNHQNGTMRLLNISITLNADAEGRLIGILGMAKDITKEHRLQDQLIQSQKMEAIGTLAGGVAHDFNNLLMGMQANIALIRQEMTPKASITEKFNRIEDQIKNGATLTRQLLGYARKGKYRVRALEVNSMIEDALHVVQRANKKITIQSDPTRKPAYIKADKGQFELILLNLFLNAVDAMPNGGTLAVEAGILSIAGLKERWPDAAPNETYLELTIIDTGMGMDEATRQHIFDPFFTTKERGQGTGLGLASVYGMVQNHEGHIQVTSQPGKGTTFRLLFPAIRHLDDPKRLGPRPAVMAQDNATIMLVEDEPLVLKSCHEMIESLGYHVISAESGPMALELYKDRIDEIDLVVLDMVMPGMDGWQTYGALKKLNSDIKVIVTSGYAEDDRIDAILSQGRNHNLKKPYTRDELAHACAAALHPTGQGEGVGGFKKKTCEA